MKPTLRKPVFVLLVLAFTALACGLPGGQQPVEPTLLPTDAVVVAFTPAPTLAPTGVPAPQPTPVPTLAGRMAQFENVLFVVPPDLSMSEQGQIVLPVSGGAAWEVSVQHTAFSFTGYMVSGASREPAIYVYPVDGFDMAADTIANLRNVLSMRPADAQPMPFLPPENSVQMLRAQVKYLDFASGSGVRYLTQYGQGIWPLNNKDMFYTFQGLTNDGKYYISVVMPIYNSLLPATGDGADLEQLSADYPGYIAGVRAQLDAEAESSFTPSLAELDALVQSITVK